MNEVETNTPATPPMRPGALPEPPKTSGLAVASLVCGIAGLCTFVTAIVGVILGVIALRQIRRSNGRLGGDGLAIGGIATSCATLIVSLIVGFMVVGITLPAVAVARQAAQAQRANTVARQIASSMVTYHTTYNSAFPPADDWTQALQIADAGLGDAVRALALNEHLAGLHAYDIADPGNTVMLFEVPQGGASVGGRDLLPDQPHYRDGYLIVFVDAHTEFIPAEDVDDLIWDPRPPD